MGTGLALGGRHRMERTTSTTCGLRGERCTGEPASRLNQPWSHGEKPGRGWKQEALKISISVLPREAGKIPIHGLSRKSGGVGEVVPST